MMRLTRFVLACFLAIGLVRAAAAGEVLVLEVSSGLAFEKGQIVDGAREIAVPAGGRVVLMDQSGRTVALEGPYRGVPFGEASGDPGVLRRLSALVTNEGQGSRGTVIGAVRDMDVPPPPPRRRPEDPWLVDVTKNGERCVPRGPVRLWRIDPRRGVTLVMRGEKPRTEWTRAEWPARRQTLPWPKGLARADGAKYRVMLDGPLTTKFISLHLAPRDFASDAARLLWLFESGCREQAQTLIDRIAAKSAAPR